MSRAIIRHIMPISGRLAVHAQIHVRVAYLFFCLAGPCNLNRSTHQRFCANVDIPCNWSKQTASGEFAIHLYI